MLPLLAALLLAAFGCFLGHVVCPPFHCGLLAQEIDLAVRSRPYAACPINTQSPLASWRTLVARSAPASGISQKQKGAAIAAAPLMSVPIDGARQGARDV
jgi:hypothetical protein